MMILLHILHRYILQGIILQGKVMKELL